MSSLTVIPDNALLFGQSFERGANRVHSRWRAINSNSTIYTDRNFEDRRVRAYWHRMAATANELNISNYKNAQLAQSAVHPLSPSFIPRA